MSTRTNVPDDQPSHDEELAARIVADPLQAVRLFYEVYTVLKVIHNQGEWDTEYYSEAVEVWDRLGDWMYP